MIGINLRFQLFGKFLRNAFRFENRPNRSTHLFPASLRRRVRFLFFNASK